MRVLDLFCGRWGIGKVFAKRGHEVIGVDLVEPPETPNGCTFLQLDVLGLTTGFILDRKFDFLWASSPCEEFSVHGMKNFHPNPKYPENGIKLFNHTRQLCEASGLPYVMENVRAAQQFVGNAVHHCGPFYLWGNAVPPLMPQGILKGMRRGNTRMFKVLQGKERTKYRNAHSGPGRDGFSHSKERIAEKVKSATIPPELAACVADYAERLLEARR